MKKTVYIATLITFVCSASVAQANHEFDDYAHVIDVTPQYEQVNVPSRECSSEYIPEREHRRGSLVGPLIGGIAGGVLGAQVGQGNGRIASSAAGAAIGAIVGGRMSDRGRDRDRYYDREVRHCEVVDHWETRLTGYRVVYRYHGHVQTTILPYDPGRRLRVRVAIEPADTARNVGEKWDR